MAQSSCFVCPGSTKIWIASAAGVDGIPTGSWYALPHTISVQIEPSVEDPTEIRTSDTAGLKIAVGSGATSYALNVVSGLTEENWLYAFILDSDATWGRTLPANGATLWFALDWNSSSVPDSSLTAASIATPDNGSTYTITRTEPDYAIYLKGTVEPGGYGMDNDSTDPVRAEWSVNISNGPYFPDTTGTLYGGDAAPYLIVQS